MRESSDADRADSIEAFASDLRKRRLEAGSPTLARLQSETGISRSVISDAFAGKYLPSARTLDALVRVLNGDPNEWIERRDELAGRRDVVAPADEPAEDIVASGTQPPGKRKRTLALSAGAGFLAGALVSALVTAVVVSQVLPSAPEARADDEVPQIEVANGEDPAFTECVDDAEVVAAESRVDETLLEIIWSNKCYAGWGRITRYDGLDAGNTVTIAIYPDTAPTGEDRQEATEHGVAGAYTTLVVRPSPDTLLCAEGSFTVDGETIDLGEPLCT